MIQANELRIGSLTDKGVVKTFFEKGIHVGFGKCYEFSDLEPITLTEDILLKIPIFKLNISNKDSGYRQFGFQLNSFDFMFTIECNNEPLFYLNNKIIKLKGLHHLQNIVYDLKGTELEINL